MPRYIFCPNCGATRDVSGDYTSPANRALDARDWGKNHLSGACSNRPFPEKKEKP